MIYFIIRRLILTVFLLLLVSAITFAIFFLVPRLAGQTAYQLAAQYVGRNPTRQAILQVEQQLGLGAPLYLQYGRFLKAIVLGAHFRSGPTVAYCPPPCFGYSFRTQQPVWPQMVSDIPVTLSLAIGLGSRDLVSRSLERTSERSREWPEGSSFAAPAPRRESEDPLRHF